MDVALRTLFETAVRNASKTEGWDFSYVKGQRHEEKPPWSYEEVVLSHLGKAHSVLDMDAGGGERLRSLYAILPPCSTLTPALGQPKTVMKVAACQMHYVFTAVIGPQGRAVEQVPLMKAGLMVADIVRRLCGSWTGDLANSGRESC